MSLCAAPDAVKCGQNREHVYAVGYGVNDRVGRRFACEFLDGSTNKRVLSPPFGGAMTMPQQILPDR